MTEYRPEVHRYSLHHLRLRCTRCGHVREIAALDTLEYERSRYLELRNHGQCSKGHRDGHFDCLRGCTHPHPLVLIYRVLAWPFTRRAIRGECVIVADVIERESSSVLWHGVDDAYWYAAEAYYAEQRRRGS